MIEQQITLKSRALLLGMIVLLSFGMAACGIAQTAPSESDTTAQAPEDSTMAENGEMSEEPAMDEAPRPSEIGASDDTHVVSSGESLWVIAGMTSIYNDPFRWPIIYARNADIEDADLIYPGQELSIRRDLSRAEIDSAVMHARNRGAWAIGAIEDSDTAYRSSTM